MATRFRKHRTRKMKQKKALKTRRQRGSGVLNKLTGLFKRNKPQNSGTLKIRVPPTLTPNSLLTPTSSPRTPNSLGNSASTITDSPRNRLGSMNSGISMGSTGSRRSTGANVGRLIQMNRNAQQRYKNQKAKLNAQIQERNRKLQEQLAKEKAERNAAIQREKEEYNALIRNLTIGQQKAIEQARRNAYYYAKEANAGINAELSENLMQERNNEEKKTGQPQTFMGQLEANPEHWLEIVNPYAEPQKNPASGSFDFFYKTRIEDEVRKMWANEKSRRMKDPRTPEQIRSNNAWLRLKSSVGAL